MVVMVLIIVPIPSPFPTNQRYVKGPMGLYRGFMSLYKG